MTDSFRMTTEMSAAFGYDDLGNAPDLLAEKDRKVLQEGSWTRSSADMICWRCNIAYRLHPRVQGALWLRRTCDAGLVKL